LLSFAWFACAWAAGDTAAEGKILFEQKCAACHTIGGGVRVGPDLMGVHERRTPEWLFSFVTHPDRMIAQKDPTALRLVEQYNRIVMPNLGLQTNEAEALLSYLKSAAAGAAGTTAASTTPLPRAELAAPQSIVLSVFLFVTAVIMLVFAWVGFSTRSPSEVDVKKAYGVRKVIFASAALVVVVLLFATLPNVPYAVASKPTDRIVHVTARQFNFVFSEEPIVSVSELGRVATLEPLVLPLGAQVEFRVTSLDVNHGFGLYGPQRQLLAQTQAMPGYVNRLRVTLSEPGQYKVFCLEYCAAGHHFMQTGFVVK
jgi:cytochrome c oxidase subunit 2